MKHEKVLDPEREARLRLYEQRAAANQNVFTGEDIPMFQPVLDKLSDLDFEDPVVTTEGTW